MVLLENGRIIIIVEIIAAVVVDATTGATATATATIVYRTHARPAATSSSAAHLAAGCAPAVRPTNWVQHLHHARSGLAAGQGVALLVLAVEHAAARTKPNRTVPR